jgi:hypothetical protein
MTALFRATAFAGAFLYFVVQPMFARRLLPHLGGAPVVWSTMLVFFQLLLLAGYAYAHAAGRSDDLIRSRRMHLLIAALPVLLSGAAAIAWGSPLIVSSQAEQWLDPQSQPVLGLLASTLLAVGLPGFVLAAGTPILQRWFANSRAAPSDPYALFAAANAGSLAALIGYPLLIERWYGLTEQSWIWYAGYAAYVALLCACAATTRTASARFGSCTAATATDDNPAAGGLSRMRQFRWLGLAAAPAAALAGVTGFLTMDLASVPLLWIIPLALYLLTFILVFGRRRFVTTRLVLRYVPLVMLVWSITLVLDATEPIVVLMAVHLAAFFWIALACHQALHDDRPPPSDLTKFYLVLAAGGFAGGLVSALLVPVLFDSRPEYPLAMLAGCALAGAVRTGSPRSPIEPAGDSPRRLAPGLLVPVLLAGGLAFGVRILIDGSSFAAEETLSSVTARYVRGAALTLPVLACLIAASRPLSFAAALAAVLAVTLAGSARHGDVLLQERTWFGIHRVTRHRSTGAHLLVHGNTVHGIQQWSPEPSSTPGAYYHPDGPAGDIFELLNVADGPRSVAVIGLGAGSLASYARERPLQHWTFFEIDPAVVRIARNPDYFTYLQDAFPHPERLQIVTGDGRLRLREVPDARFDLIVVDAFSSDAVPAHLLTTEAVSLYTRKLKPDGKVAFHISNRNLQLASLLAALADAHEPPLIARQRFDGAYSRSRHKTDDRLPSHWVVMARSEAPLQDLATRWLPLQRQPMIDPWSDDYADLTAVLINPFAGSD